MRRGFSLIEILVVIGIVAVISGLALSVNREDGNEIHVRAAAQELAAVFRETRERAIRSRQTFAVVFNIENAPGSSGRVLNNRSGGHWYRVIGPTPGVQGDSFQIGSAPIFEREQSGMGGAVGEWGIPGPYVDNPIRLFLESVEKAWIGEPHRLPAKRVRFLALNDQDNGDFCSAGDTYPETYPRPWFGTWDPVTRRIHAWGGYDPDLPMTNQTGFERVWHQTRNIGGRVISHTGFFYEGYDGTIDGCRQPCDRMVLDDTNGDGVIIVHPTRPEISDDTTKRYPLWKANDPRPLINAAWEDSMILFRPDGTVWSSWMRLRHQYAYRFHRSDYLCYDPALWGGDVTVAAPSGHFSLKELAPFDMCNRIVDTQGEYANNLRIYSETTTFQERSGFHFVTLAPDVLDDRDTFPDADAYVRQLSPCYRVGISTYGEVKIIRVRTTPQAGRTMDTTISGSGWNDKSTTDVFYQKGMLTNPDGSPRGDPIVDRVTPDMLRQRTWWWQ
jgi:prepilin-type N-terminal cleavage/methylation domain-containing protein